VVLLPIKQSIHKAAANLHNAAKSKKKRKEKKAKKKLKRKEGLACSKHWQISSNVQFPPPPQSLSQSVTLLCNNHSLSLKNLLFISPSIASPHPCSLASLCVPRILGASEGEAAFDSPDMAMAAAAAEAFGTAAATSTPPVQATRQDVQAAIAKAVELRALHAALLQRGGGGVGGGASASRSPAIIRLPPAASPALSRAGAAAAAVATVDEDYPVFTPVSELFLRTVTLSLLSLMLPWRCAFLVHLFSFSRVIRW
jgi:hypothetical protein